MYYQSPLSWLMIETDQKGITAITFTDKPDETERLAQNKQPNKLALRCCEQLTEYFAGKRQDFTLPLSFKKGTTFQRAVWEQLCAIPYGTIWNYQQVAEAVHSPKAFRAVGQANRANPIPILVPCHRVIGKNGKLTGYMGAESKGLEIKAALLHLEKATFLKMNAPLRASN